MSRSDKGTWITALLVAGGVYLAFTHWHRPPAPKPPHFVPSTHPLATNPLMPKSLRLADGPLGSLIGHEQYNPDEKLPADALIIRAQPCVFQLQMVGRATRIVPTSITFNASTMEADYARAASAGTLPVGESKSATCWRMLALKPGRYLIVSPQTVRSSFTGVYATGTAFAIRSDGVFLTNAHMAPARETRIAPDFANLDLLNDLRPCFKEIVAAIGNCPEPNRSGNPVVAWAIGQCRVGDAKFDHLELVLDFAADNRDYFRALVGAAMKTRGNQNDRQSDGETPTPFMRRPVTRRCIIIDRGTIIPGRDVAIIRIAHGFEGKMDGGGLSASGKLDDVAAFQSAADRYICLPLGDSDAVLAGSNIQAMGFPGSGFNPTLMDASAAFRVSAENGQISNTKRMQPTDPNEAQYDAFEMTAEINHGDSGGPVIDNRGRVIAINVGAAQDSDARGHTLAIPINIAREMLKKNHVTPDPGNLTQKWVEAVRLFHDGKYSAAAAALDEVRRMQMTAPPPGSAVLDPDGANGRVNPYVDDLYRRAVSLSAGQSGKK